MIGKSLQPAGWFCLSAFNGYGSIRKSRPRTIFAWRSARYSLLSVRGLYTGGVSASKKSMTTKLMAAFHPLRTLRRTVA
jgi:hypothetical protein